MLSELIIENVAVIEKASLTLNKGFTCLTGETGAGKSIIIDSINAIMGERVSKDVIRTGAAKASIVAVFDNIEDEIIAKARELEIDISNECIVQRQISQEGKSSARINGIPVSVSTIRSIFQDAINIHGQHDSQSLLNPIRHQEVLDSFGVDTAILRLYIEIYDEYINILSKIKELSLQEKNKKENLELLAFQVEEIETANLSLEEEASLNEEKKLIKNYEKIISAMNTTYSLFSGDDDLPGIVSDISKAVREIDSISGFSSEIMQLSENINELFQISQDAIFEIKNIIDSFDVDMSKIDEIEERLDLYYKLKRKYANSVADIINYGNQAKEKLENIEFAKEKLEQLDIQKAACLRKLTKAANILTDTRIKIFDDMSLKIQKSLEFLNMPYVKLLLNIKDKNFSKDGKDSIEFTIVTNKGEAPKPLAKIASGGELSRIMLAIKSVLAQKEFTGTLIFDEIDSGVSGAASLKIGRLLKETATNRQIICVTHSPQIAAFADNHLFIQKNVVENATFTNVKELSVQERIAEIARIISGENITATAIENAREMFESAQNS